MAERFGCWCVGLLHRSFVNDFVLNEFYIFLLRRMGGTVTVILLIPDFYGIIFWGNPTDAIQVFQMQKKFIKLITKSSFINPCRQNFRRLKVLPLPSLYIIRSLLFVHLNSDKNSSAKTTSINISLETPLSCRIQIIEHVSWKGCCIVVQKFSITCPNIRNQPSHKTFQTLCQQYLLKNCFNSIQEFLSWSLRHQVKLDVTEMLNVFFIKWLLWMFLINIYFKT